MAKVILLAGQSNAEGCTYSSYLPVDLILKSIKGYQNIQIFYETNNQKNFNFEPVCLGQGFDSTRFGLELGLADYLCTVFPNETIYIIKYTKGGTSFKKDWSSVSSGHPYHLYFNMLNRVKEGFNLLQKKNIKGDLLGVLWMQGESDSDQTLQDALNYKALVRDFINDIRYNLGYLSSNGIPFIQAGISDSKIWPAYKIINQAKEEISKELKDCDYFSTISKQYPYSHEPLGNPDLCHYDAIGEYNLGIDFGKHLEKYLKAASKIQN